MELLNTKEYDFIWIPTCEFTCDISLKSSLHGDQVYLGVCTIKMLKRFTFAWPLFVFFYVLLTSVDFKKNVQYLSVLEPGHELDF